MTLPLLATFLWLAWCWGAFNGSSWNDIRLAPVFGLKLDGVIYGGPHGAPNTWMYGPLPVWSMWPATWAGDPATALGTAGLLNITYTLLAIAAVCALTPVRGGRVRPVYRFLAALLAIALWPRATWQFLQADNLAIATGLVSNLVLMRRRSSTGSWIAALFATAGLLCKQTAIAVPAAQVLWVGFTAGWRPALEHLARLAGAGAVWLVLVFSIEDPAALWFSLMTLPGGLPWASDWGTRFSDTAGALALQLFVPLLLWAGLRNTAAGKSLALPLLSWLLAVPPGLAALFTYGGNINSMQGFALLLPAGAVALIAHLSAGRSATRILLSGSAVVLSLILFNLRGREMPPHGINTRRYDDAMAVARAFPDGVWFPWNPMVTIYSEGRRFADEDGLAVWALANHAISLNALTRHLPPHFTAIALPAGLPHWGVAYELRPAHAHRSQIGEWLIDDWSLPAQEKP